MSFNPFRWLIWAHISHKVMFSEHRDVKVNFSKLLDFLSIVSSEGVKRSAFVNLSLLGDVANHLLGRFEEHAFNHIVYSFSGNIGVFIWLDSRLV